MPLFYTIKRISRTWKLFVALLIGVILASSFFAGIYVKANLTAEQALEQQIKDVLIDMEFNNRVNLTNHAQTQQDILSIEGVKDVELLSRSFASMFSSSDNSTAPLNSQIIYLPNSSRVWDGWQNKPPNGIGENETYILADTFLADRVAINDTLQMSLEFPTPKYDNTTTIYLNLTVAGFAPLPDEAYSFA